MQKVEGSSPFSRSLRKPRSSGVFCCPEIGSRRRFRPALPLGATTSRFPLDHPLIWVEPAVAPTDAVLISAPRPRKQLRLRRPDQCRVCSTELPVGTTAIWDPTARTVTCMGCSGPEVTAGPTAPIDPGQPGASALREYQRRHDARDQRARDKLGGVGAFLVKLTDEPSSIRVWQQGGNGEVRVGARLEKLLEGTGIRLLHDRRARGTATRTSTTSPSGREASRSSTPRPSAGGSAATGKADSSPSDGRSSASTAATRPS